MACGSDGASGRVGEEREIHHPLAHSPTRPLGEIHDLATSFTLAENLYD